MDKQPRMVPQGHWQRLYSQIDAPGWDEVVPVVNDHLVEVDGVSIQNRLLAAHLRAEETRRILRWKSSNWFKITAILVYNSIPHY